MPLKEKTLKPCSTKQKVGTSVAAEHFFSPSKFQSLSVERERKTQLHLSSSLSPRLTMPPAAAATLSGDAFRALFPEEVRFRTDQGETQERESEEDSNQKNRRLDFLLLRPPPPSDPHPSSLSVSLPKHNHSSTRGTSPRARGQTGEQRPRPGACPSPWGPSEEEEEARQTTTPLPPPPLLPPSFISYPRLRATAAPWCAAAGPPPSRRSLSRSRWPRSSPRRRALSPFL